MRPCPSTTWMPLLVELLKALGCYMSIYLGGRDVGMTKHGLNAAEVRAALYEMSGKAVSQHMGFYPLLLYAGKERCFLYNLPEILSCHGTAAERQKQKDG